ncbi:MAG: pyridoxal phosphate-dependent aminotransferase [Oscillospiraceae bacterium]|nr:pyridoxal phosphate-dependent aminotransferase [Oscillospiraceae bacterium]
MLNQTMLALGKTRSCIRELFSYGLAQAAIVGKENVFDYSLGNPSIPAPPEVNKAIVDIVEHTDSLAVHSYTPAQGLPEARKAVAEDLNRRYGTAIRPDNLFFTCGAAPALIAVIRALGVEGAEIIGIAPFFPEYRPFAESNGVRFVAVPAETGSFQIDFEKLEAAIGVHTQAVIVNSPNNPSGVIYTRETLEKLAALLTRKSAEIGHPIFIIADEPYRELAYDGAEVVFIPTVYRNTIVCYSYSKSLSLPGERIGYVCVSDEVEDSADVYAAIAGAARASGHVCAPSLQQRVIALCASSRPNVDAYDSNRELLYENLSAYGYECVKPKGAFYMFVKAPGGDSQRFSDRAKERNLLLVPGDGFGCPAYFRISTCVSPDMIRRSLPIFKALIDEE